MMLRAVLVTMVGLAVQVACSTAHASPASEAYCHSFAEGWYQQATWLGSETPDGVYEQAMADCESQFAALELDPELDGLNAPTPEDVLGKAVNAAVGMSLDEAWEAARDQGAECVTRVGANRWLPTEAR